VLTVALVNAYDYLGRGAEYVAKMVAMVDRNLRAPHEFKVLGDCGCRDGGTRSRCSCPGNSMAGFCIWTSIQ
jgi:hypothetical protein